MALPRGALADVVRAGERRALRGRWGPAAGGRGPRDLAHAGGDHPGDRQDLRAASGAPLGGRRARRARLPRLAARALEPAAGGTHVVTEETERGPLPWLLRWYLRGALHGAHQKWLESLARVAVGGPPAALAR